MYGHDVNGIFLLSTTPAKAAPCATHRHGSSQHIEAAENSERCSPLGCITSVSRRPSCRMRGCPLPIMSCYVHSYRHVAINLSTVDGAGIAIARHQTSKSSSVRPAWSFWHRYFAGPAACRCIVEEGEIAYGKHIWKEGETGVPQDLLQKFLKVQNGADIRGVVLDGVLLPPHLFCEPITGHGAFTRLGSCLQIALLRPARSKDTAIILLFRCRG